MDMLREAGRRSDAHVARYTLAADWVRRNDVVLDAGCGLGYGAHVLRSLTHARQVIGLDADERAVAYARDNFGVGVAELEYRTGDLQDLSFLPDHSLDVVVCFEAVEHVPDPDRFFAEARRVLRPGGRVVVSVPNQWCDEHGHDPNPHHLHVYTWDKLRSQLQRRFLLETAYQQIAGNGVVLSDRPRRLRSISVEAAPTVESEWWIMVGTADPTQPPCVPYQEVFYDYSAPPEHLLAFARDYANPWLVRALVEYPTRAVNRDVLLDVAGRVLADAGDGSADQGAALCVHGYRVLESDSASAEEVETFLSRLDGYLALPPQNAHQFRWRISLAFLRGQLHLKLGRFAEARAAFDFCADMDCRPFSPTLGTKTVLAAFLSGWLNYVHADVATARQRWSRGLTEAQRLLHADWAEFLGNPETPLPFPLVTAVEFLDSAVLCANALRVTAARAAVPVSLVWSEIHKCWKQMINERWRAMQRMEAMISERDETISDQARRLEERWRLVQHMDAQARSRDDIIGEQSRLLDERWAIMQRMDAMIAARDEALSAQARMLEARWRIMQHMEAEVRARDEVIAQQARRLAETEGGRPDEVRLRSDGRTR
jgi:SAM-dependent methyltransferase